MESFVMETKLYSTGTSSQEFPYVFFTPTQQMRRVLTYQSFPAVRSTLLLTTTVSQIPAAATGGVL